MIDNAYRGHVLTVDVGPSCNAASVVPPTSACRMTSASSRALGSGSGVGVTVEGGTVHQMEWQAVTQTVGDLQRLAVVKLSPDAHRAFRTNFRQKSGSSSACNSTVSNVHIHTLHCVSKKSM